jgi:replicative DNA helicase
MTSMTGAQPRSVLELVGTETPAAGWVNANWSEMGEPLAEAAVLGCLLRTDRQHAAALLGAFTDEDLTVPQHRHVAAAARVLLEQGHPIDPVTVLGQLRRQGSENARTDHRNAGVLLVELCQAAPCVSSAGHYLRIVLEHSYRRRAQQSAARLLQVGGTGSLTALHDLVEREHEALAAAYHRTTVALP